MKAIWQLIGAVLVAVLPLLTGDHHLATSEWVNILLVALGAATVYIAGNLPTGPWQLTKTIMSALQAGAVVLVSVLTEGVTATEWFQVGAAILTVWAVYQVPARGTTTPPGRHREGQRDGTTGSGSDAGGGSTVGGG